MIKKAFVLLGVVCASVTGAQAQICVTDEVNRKYQQQHPEMVQVSEQLEREIAENIQKLKLGTMMRGTGVDTDTAFLTIPVVVHIVHDYGVEYLADDRVYQMIDELNAVYSKLNVAQLAQVIPTFVPYIGNMRLRFALATKDPNGNPTHGITRPRSYLTAGGDDQAKLDYWPQNKYLNIWFERVIGMGTGGAGIVAAYSAYPSSVAFNPYGDGLIANYQFINSTGLGSNTVPHEIGHYFNLSHPWGNNNSAGVACGDDNVPDTPPTKGHFGGCNVFDTDCAVGYTSGGIDYPDTTNVQNIMDYADCELMFTQGQKERVRAALRSNVGNRSNLWSASNLTATGALAPRPSMPPVADFSNVRNFACAGNSIAFVNRSWNDTVTNVAWTFSNGAAAPVSSATSALSNSFTDPGWVTTTLTATGGGGSNTVSKQSLYIADPNAIPAQAYTEEFVPGSAHADQYPIFNYFNTPRKWEVVSNAGVYDNYSMRYTNNDLRTGAAAETNTPQGDYSDFYTPAFNISDPQFAGTASLTYFTSGAYRTSGQLNDLLEIAYSIDCGSSWRKLDSLKGANIANNAVTVGDFTPQSQSQWQLRGSTLPTAAKGAKVFFRFRYRPGVNASSLKGTGNNFYIDRINVTSNTLGINEQELNADGIAIAPNPTSGNAWLVLSNKNAGDAQVQVTDITGKVVFRTHQLITGTTKIEIPANTITVKGMYLVHVLTENQSYTKKLIVY